MIKSIKCFQVKKNYSRKIIRFDDLNTKLVIVLINTIDTYSSSIKLILSIHKVVLLN